MWTVAKLIFYAFLFIGTGIRGVGALIHHTDAGWLAGFVFCSAGTYLFGHNQRGLLFQVFGTTPKELAVYKLPNERAVGPK